MEDLKSPRDWGKWIFDSIHDEKKHPELEAALHKHIPDKEHQWRVTAAFVKYAEAASGGVSNPIERIEYGLSNAETLETELMDWIQKQQPQLTKNMHYAALRSLRALTAAMEQLCWIAERLKGDYDQIGLEYQEMTRLCVSDATCAIDLCGFWIDIMLAYVQTLNVEVVENVTLETKDLVGRLDSCSRRTHLEIRNEVERLRAKQLQRQEALDAIKDLRPTLQKLYDERSICVNNSLENSIKSMEERIFNLDKESSDLWGPINACQQKLSRLQSSTLLISNLRDGMKEVNFLDEELRNSMADFKVKLDTYKRHVSSLHNAEAAMGSMTSWKDMAAEALLNTTKESLFCYPAVPYARRVVESILAGYDSNKKVPRLVKDAADAVTDAIFNLHEPFPLPLPPGNGKADRGGLAG